MSPKDSILQETGHETGPGALSSVTDWAARARALQPLIEAAGDRIESTRKVTDDVMSALHEAGLFRMLLPQVFGGGEATPRAAMEVLEAVSAADASTGWCLGQALGCSLAAAFLSADVAHEIFDDPRAVVAWGPPSGAKAITVDGGYRISGRWRFASGSPNATWLGGHSIVCDADGAPRKGPDGKPVMRTLLFPIASAELTDVWHVLGLRGTGSNDYAVKDLFVPDDHTTWRDSAPDRREHGPLYNIPLLTMYGMMFAGVALGIGRAMLDAFCRLANDKVGSGMTTVLRDNAVIQSQVAQAEGHLRSARAYLIEMIEETWATAQAGEPFPLDQRARLRIAITQGMNKAKDVVDFAYHAAGTNAIFESGPFERRFRDMHTVTQQGQAHLVNFESAGQALFGLTPGHRL